MAYRFGRKPPVNKPALMLASFMTGITPPHPDKVDYLAQLDHWAMLGNDQYGDCVAVTWANVRRLVTAKLSVEDYPDMNQVEALYKTQNPTFDPSSPGDSGDQGMSIQLCLEHLTKDVEGVRAICFAKVDHRNEDEVKAAIALFGYVWVGINVQAANMAQFDEGVPWDYIADSPIEGGHSIIVGGYNSDSRRDENFITWAKETAFTSDFWTHLVEEAWVVVWPEHLGTRSFQQGVNVTALADSFTQLTGRPFPHFDPPNPIPVPVPTPAPVVDPTNVTAEQLDTALTNWLHAKKYDRKPIKTLRDIATRWLLQ